MKALLRFNLDEPEDRRKYEICNKAEEYHFCINDVLDKIRQIDKHSSKTSEENWDDLKEFILVNAFEEYRLPLHL